MGGIIIAIILVASIVLILSILGIGGSFFEATKQAIDDRISKQSEQADPQTTTNGNFAKDPVFDTDGDGVGDRRVCNLKLEFVGSVEGHIWDNGISLFQGSYLRDYNGDGNVATFADYLSGNIIDVSAVHYDWFCDQGLFANSFIDMAGFNLANAIGNPQVSSSLELQSTTEVTDNTDIRFFVTGESMRTGKDMLASQKENTQVTTGAFSASQTLNHGTKLPSDYSVTMFLYGVTEDDYEIEYFSKDWRMNGQNVNKKFYFDICSKTYLDSLSLLRIAGATNPHTTTKTTNDGDIQITTVTTEDTDGSTTEVVSYNQGEDGSVTTTFDDGSTSSTQPTTYIADPIRTC